MSDIFLGLILGLLSATIFESVGHRVFGHPSSGQLRLYFSYPRFFAPFLRAYYHHFVVHHELTYQTDILTQFRSQQEKERIDSWIAQKFPIDFACLIWKEQYNLTLKGLQGTLPFALPFLTGPLLISYFFGPTVGLASLLTAFVPVFMSKYLHPLVHKPELWAQAPTFFKKISRTRYMRWVFENHLLHHKHLNCNFNLLLGGDYLVGAHRFPSGKEKVEIQKLWERFQSL